MTALRKTPARGTEADPILLGLIGQGISGSLTPTMHEVEGAANGLLLAYRLIDADVHGFSPHDLQHLVRWARTLGYRGLNVTHPFKQAVMSLVDELSDEARHIGAVNTIVFDGDQVIGHNTDWSGFESAFEIELASVQRGHVVQIGAGGAGLAVGYSLLRLGVGQLTLIDTDAARAHACAERLGAIFGFDRVIVESVMPRSLDDTDGVVNATPIGMTGHEGVPMDVELLEARHWVADVVYFPRETQLVRSARDRGCSVMPGGGMAVGQAIGAFEIFTEIGPDTTRMRKHFQELSDASS